MKTEAGHLPGHQRSSAIKSLARMRNIINKNKHVFLNRTLWTEVVPSVLEVLMHGSGKKNENEICFRFIACHHKSMTTYFNVFLKCFSFFKGFRYRVIHGNESYGKAEIVLFTRSKIDFNKLVEYRGVHVLRDPRDMIVSGYHYHKWCDEEWVHRLDDGGRSYQDKLNDVDKKIGLFMEIDHFAFMNYVTLKEWPLDNAHILEVSYEDLMGDNRLHFYEKILNHLGFSGSEFRMGLALFRLFEAERRTSLPSTSSRGHHIRSGKSGQWRDELEAEHLEYIDTIMGDILDKFGYARCSQRKNFKF